MNASAGQLELALLRANLHSFERGFYRIAGPRYVELDETRAQAAKLHARFVPAAHRESLAAREQARLSAQEYSDSRQHGSADSETLRRMHHDLARDFHPDLASDEARRMLCERLMTEVNLAFQEGDAARLEILRGALDHDENGDAARRLAELARSPIAELHERVTYAGRHHHELLRDLALRIAALTEEAKQRGARLLPQAGRPRTLIARALQDLVPLLSVRRIRFPAASLGELSIRAERDIDAALISAGPASGEIAVPFGKALLLRLNAESADLSALSNFDPEDLQGLIDEWPGFVSVNDEQLRPLAHFNGLEELRLGRTEVTGRIFDRFHTLHELRVLILEETQFDDAGLLRLEDCIWMQRLDLSFTQVTGPGLSAIRNMTALRELSLYGTAVTDRDLAVTGRIPGLRNLNLGLTTITDGVVTHLSGLRSLEVLNLGGTAVTDAALDALGELPALRELVLWETAISPACMEKLKRFPALRYLDADQTAVTPEAIAAFRAERPDVRLPSDIWAETD